VMEKKLKLTARGESKGVWLRPLLVLASWFRRKENEGWCLWCVVGLGTMERLGEGRSGEGLSWLRGGWWWRPATEGEGSEIERGGLERLQEGSKLGGGGGFLDKR
jgi:hypothetical protein